MRTKTIRLARASCARKFGQPLHLVARGGDDALVGDGGGQPAGASHPHQPSHRVTICAAELRHFRPDIVAENSSACRVGGSVETMRRTSGQQAHVEHAIGFVEHEHFEQRSEVRRALLFHVIEQPSGRGDDPGRRRRSRRDPADLSGDTAEHSRAGESRDTPRPWKSFLDLQRELTRRREHEHARRLRTRVYPPSSASSLRVERSAVRSAAGTPAALPVPVSAQPTKSMPDSTCGNTAPCTGVVFSN